MNIQELTKREIDSQWVTAMGFKPVESKSQVYMTQDHYYLETQSGYIYLRPSYEGGYYWGICANAEDLSNATEFDGVKPLQTKQSLVDLLKGLGAL